MRHLRQPGLQTWGTSVSGLFDRYAMWQCILAEKGGVCSDLTRAEPGPRLYSGKQCFA